MKIISFYRGADEAPHTGCLLSDTELLDFCHPSCDLPQPAELLGWFDTESESHKAARAFGEEVQADESRQGALRAAGAIAILVGFNVFLLGFLAELQVKVSKFFRQRISVTAREAIR